MGKMKKKQLAEELNTEMTAVVALEIEKRQEPVQYDVLENELDRYIMRLKETTNVLNKTRNELTKNNRRLERLDNEFQKAKSVADESVKMIKKQLFRWLSKRSQHKVEHILHFYHQEDQIDLLDAMMTYAVTGKKAKLEKPVAQWHFRLFCEMLDDDRCTVPSHTLLIRLWKKVGLLQSISQEEKAGDEAHKVEAIRPFDQEW